MSGVRVFQDRGTACEWAQRQNEHDPSMAQTSSSQEGTWSKERKMRLFGRDKSCPVEPLLRGVLCGKMSSEDTANFCRKPGIN